MYQPVTPPPNSRQLNITLVNTWRVVNAKGGTEKVFCDMANAFVQRGHNVTAICLDENQGQPGFPIDSRVHFINAYHAQIPLSLTKLVRKLRSLSLCKEQRRIKHAALSVEVSFDRRLRKHRRMFSFPFRWTQLIFSKELSGIRFRL